jgi:hypothetical protein
LANRAKDLGLEKACDLLSQNAKIENLNAFVQPGKKGELIVEPGQLAFVLPEQVLFQAHFLIRHTGLEISGQWTLCLPNRPRTGQAFVC